MATLEASSLKIDERKLHVPQLEEIKNVLSKALPTNFETVSVEVVDCPDLKDAPFTLAASGLGGNARIIEVGGPAYLLPLVQRDKVYDIKPLINRLNSNNEKSFVIGAAAGPWPYINCNCEMMMNVAIDKNNDVDQQTRISSVNKTTGECVLQILPKNETRFALLANLLLCEGKPGKVIKVHAKGRAGSVDFISSMQKALAAHYQDKLVGLGGTFLLKQGKAKQHVMRDFSTTPINNVTQLNEWLRFYEMSSELIAVGTLVSAETDLDLRVQHFHSFSHHGEGGHYHIDTTPDTVEYLGYFNVCDTLYRVDQPPNLLNFGKD